MIARYQGGSLRQEGRRWILRRRVDGREVRLVIGMISELKTTGAARREADAKLEAMNAGARQAGERITLRRFAPIFLDDICAGKKPSTKSTYASAFSQHLLPLFGSKALSDIGLREMTHLAADLHRRERSPKTIRAVCAVLATALHKATTQGYAANRIDLRSLRLGAVRAVQERRRIFSTDQIQRIIHAASWPWRAFYALLAYTGMRCGEALGLPWAAIDFDKRQVRLMQAASMGRIQSTKSRGSESTLHMPEELAAELELYRVHLGELGEEAAAALAPEALLFASPQDRQRPYWSSGIRRLHWQPLLKRLQIPSAGLHAFRHSFATHLINAGCPVNVVKEILRHSDLKITMGYAAVTREDECRAADAFARSIAGTTSVATAVGAAPCTAFT